MKLPFVAFQGASGAYSEMALLDFFTMNAKPVGMELAEEVTNAVASGHYELGCLPVENSIAGNVEGHLDTIFANPLEIVGEHYLHVQHCLLGLPGTGLGTINAAFSHPMAIGQCQKFLKEKQIKGHVDYDTAGACLRLKERNITTEAVIASRRCADIYGLTVLAQNIQDIPRNYTRFVIFQSDKKNRPVFAGQGKMSLAFKAKHEPGSLLQCLNAFAKHDINLTRLQSRPVPSDPFNYLFHIDCIANQHDENFKNCQHDLARHATAIKIYGRYAPAILPSGV